MRESGLRVQMVRCASHRDAATGAKSYDVGTYEFRSRASLRSGVVPLRVGVADQQKRLAIRRQSGVAKRAAPETGGASTEGRRDGPGDGKTKAAGAMDLQQPFGPVCAGETCHWRQRLAGDAPDHGSASARA